MNNVSPPQLPARYPTLFAPFRLGGVTLKNRFVFQPHYTALGTDDGMPSDDHRAYHEARAAGGAAMIIFESTAIHPTGKMADRFVHAWDPRVIAPYRLITEAVHRHGTVMLCQLTHGGHTCLTKPPQILWAPSQMNEPSTNFAAKAMELDDIAATIAGFAVSARNAINGGFDGIEIKIAHDGLLRSFASPYFNRRTDSWGGSFEGRMRLSAEVLQAIRTEIGPECLLGVRLCLHEYTSFGYQLDYGLKMAAYLEGLGLVDYWNCDAGSFSSFWMEIPPAAVARGSFRPLNAALKSQSRLPVIAFGRIAPTDMAEDILAKGEADLIGMARQLIADPETPNKIAGGRDNLVRPCVACNDACIYQIAQEKTIRCIHNTEAGRERTAPLLARSAVARHVVVVGGGPAGLKAAETALRRGHRVTLIESARELGGQVCLAARQPEHAEIAGVVRYLAAMVADLGGKVQLGTRADPDLIAALAPDVLMIATGSEPNLPRSDADGLAAADLARKGILVPQPIAGLDLPFVHGSDEVLSGAVRLSGRVIVIDQNGHWEAAGTAEFLADAGVKVEIVSPAQIIAADLEAGNRTLFYRRAAIKGITLTPGLVLQQIAAGQLSFRPVFANSRAVGLDRHLLFAGDPVIRTGFDAVVAVIGRRSREGLYHACKADSRLAGIPIVRAGDCVVPRLIESAIREAEDLALAV